MKTLKSIFLLLAVSLAIPTLCACGDDDVDNNNIVEPDGYNSNYNDNHEYVDLGLPSGTLWATCNVGASSPEKYGNYYAWGDTKPKNDYSWSTYKYCMGSLSTITKYCCDSYEGYNGFTDDLGKLLPEDDAATTNWGGNWETPSMAQLSELCNNDFTTKVWTTENDVKGYRITSKSNGKSIFLPAAGCRVGTNVLGQGSTGHYWSNSSGRHSTDGLDFRSGYITTSLSTDRCLGQSIRPVRIARITISQTSLTLYSGETRTLVANVRPENANVIWSSSNTSVATVDQTGKVIAVGEGTCTLTCVVTDSGDVKATCQVTVKKNIKEYVDLGLPSSTLWATCNIGATSPEEFGYQFAWGETEPKSSCDDWSTYKWCNGSGNTMTKYCAESQYGYNYFTDRLTELEPEDDAATKIWGSGWQMPSLEQIKELLDNTTTTWTEQNGVSGVLFTASNGNSIFLPVQLLISPVSANFQSFYWSRSLYLDYSYFAYSLALESNYYHDWNRFDWKYLYRYDCYYVRPVRKQ